jgi:Spy/CpxP family protein refolding chaperone
MPRKSVIAVLVTLLLATIPVSAMAFGPAGHGMMGPIHDFKLLFNEEQNKKLDAVLIPTKQEIRPLIKQLMEQRQELGGMLKNETVKDEAIKTQITKISDTLYSLALKRATIIRAARKIATPEQLAKVDALEAKHKEHMKKFMDMMDKMHGQQ